jgi:hypothetical protein
MASPLWTKVGAFGEWIIIETPADLPGAQEIHNQKFADAMTELRRREADRAEPYNEEVAAMLREPWQWTAHRRPLPYSAGRGYYASEVWEPALPLKRWKPSRAPSDRQARVNAEKITKRDYVPRCARRWDKSGVTPSMFEVIYEEIGSTPEGEVNGDTGTADRRPESHVPRGRRGR